MSHQKCGTDDISCENSPQCTSQKDTPSISDGSKHENESPEANNSDQKMNVNVDFLGGSIDIVVKKLIIVSP